MLYSVSVGQKKLVLFFLILYYLKNNAKKSSTKLIWESSNFLIILKMVFWAVLISMVDPLSPIYSEIQRLQIHESAPFCRVTWTMKSRVVSASSCFFQLKNSFISSQHNFFFSENKFSATEYYPFWGYTIFLITCG